MAAFPFAGDSAEIAALPAEAEDFLVDFTADVPDALPVVPVDRVVAEAPAARRGDALATAGLEAGTLADGGSFAPVALPAAGFAVGGFTELAVAGFAAGFAAEEEADLDATAGRFTSAALFVDPFTTGFTAFAGAAFRAAAAGFASFAGFPPARVLAGDLPVGLFAAELDRGGLFAGIFLATLWSPFPMLGARCVV